MTSADTYGDYCDEYNTNPSWCGNYDSTTFDSTSQCCVCKDLENSNNHFGECINDMSTSDIYGDYCDEYDYNPEWCGNYDSSEFNSYSQCCSCWAYHA